MRSQTASSEQQFASSYSSHAFPSVARSANSKVYLGEFASKPAVIKVTRCSGDGDAGGGRKEEEILLELTVSSVHE